MSILEQQLLTLNFHPIITSPITRKYTTKTTTTTTTTKKPYLLRCRINLNLLHLPFKKIYFSQPITCIELKQLIISHKQCRAKFGMISCLEKCIIKLEGKIIQSLELIGRLKNKMYIEVTIIK
jgi:hypothetical protein